VRIIGGELRGKKLFSPGDRSIRPTADRLREAIFSIIAAEIQGAAVLDLFAGTGALGIEALSRGAASAVFVDRSRTTLAVLEKNLAACRLQDRARCARRDILKSLRFLAKFPPPFSLVFVDPPYRRGLMQPALDLLYQSRSTAPGALVVVEHSTADPLDDPGEAYRIEDQRRQGKTLVSFARCLL
jgi:16S rRNA (guanine966-N2)-methyltransferase